MIAWLIERLAEHAPPCEQVVPLLSRELDGPLPPWRRVAVWLHLTLCDACARYREHLRLLRLAMRRLAASTDAPALPADARDRLVRAVHQAL